MLGVFGNAPKCRDIEQMTELTAQKEERGRGGQNRDAWPLVEVGRQGGWVGQKELLPTL